jgi:hypothetical protein
MEYFDGLDVLRCAGEEVLCLCHELAVPTFVILKKREI